MVSIRAFGAFVELDGYRKHGLVHISQLAKQRVEKVEDVLRDGQAVWVKTLPSDSADKISLSLRQVDQTAGADLGDEPAPRGRRGGNDADNSIPRNADGSYAWGTAGALQPLERDEPAEEAELAAPKVPQRQPGTRGAASARCKRGPSPGARGAAPARCKRGPAPGATGAAQAR